jgi:hypothetical protein
MSNTMSEEGSGRDLTISRQSAVYPGYCMLGRDKLHSGKQLPTFRKKLIPGHRLRADCSPLSTCVLHGRSQRVTITDAVEIEF